MMCKGVLLWLTKIFTVLVLLSGCQSTYDKIILSSNLELEVVRFDEILYGADYSKLDSLVPLWASNYFPFYQRYTQHVIQIGGPNHEDHVKYMTYFLNNYDMNRAFGLVEEVYPNLLDVDKELTNAFKMYNHYFGLQKVPDLYTFMGGYNHSVMIDSSFIGIGLDKYLGPKAAIYGKLGWNKYLVQNMHAGKISSDVMDSWVRTDYPLDKASPELIEAMIYHGKVHYVTKQLMPNLPDTIIFGFDGHQLSYVQGHEQHIWAFLLEQEYLFNSNSMLVNRLTSVGPFTKEFTHESPSRAVNWTGYKIVESYMNATGASLKALMNEPDARKILKLSKYKP